MNFIEVHEIRGERVELRLINRDQIILVAPASEKDLLSQSSILLVDRGPLMVHEGYATIRDWLCRGL